MNSTLKKLFAILTTLTVIAGLGFALLSNTALAPLLTIYLAVFYMPIPLYSLLILKFVFKTDLDSASYFNLKGLSIKTLGKLIITFIIWFAILLLLTFIFSSLFPSTFGSIITNNTDFLKRISLLTGGIGDSSAMNLPASPLLMFPIVIVSAIIAGLTINGLFAMGEEILWRGYLIQAFKSMSFLKRNLIIGLIWGLWHAPLVIQGYNYGTEMPWAGCLMFIVFCSALSLLMGRIAESTKNSIYAAIFHGMFNAIAGVFVVMLSIYNPFLDGAIGIISILAFIITYFISGSLFKNPNT